MNNKYLLATFLIALAIVVQTIGFNAVASGNPAIDSTKTTLKFKDNRPNRPTFLPPLAADFQSFMLKVSAIKSISPVNKNITTKTTKSIANTFEAQKPLDNVKIYPNPVSDQLNLSYTLSKDNLVTIKILDVLGNEVVTLLSQKIAAGEQTNSFNLNSKLNSGLYFVRVVAGSESVIKRISVL